MATLAMYNVKGGVGKTATTVNLAAVASAEGLRTLVWDLDPQGAASFYFEREVTQTDARRVVEARTSLERLVTDTDHELIDLIPASFSYRMLDIVLGKLKSSRTALKRLLAPFDAAYDVILLDCPPSLSKLADSIFIAADRIMVPVVPTWLSVRAHGQLVDYLDTKGMDSDKLKPFYSMVDRRKSLHRDLTESPPRDLRRLCRTEIPYLASIERMGEYRGPVFGSVGATSPAALAYAALWLEAKRGLKLRPGKNHGDTA